jgi:hypothetical protein
MSTNNFAEACATYKLLREKGYPEKATLKLVGDRHRLSRLQRNCLFRGVIVQRAADERRKKIAAPASLSGQALGLDWYNVLITVESYLRGQILFLADDGMVRDASETHGSYKAGALTVRAMSEILYEVGLQGPSRVDAYLDMPMAFSGLMAEELRTRLAALPCPVEVDLVASADFPLKTYAGVVASSDSVVLDSCTRVVDLARAVLEDRFGFTPPAVHDVFPGSPESPPQ